MAGFFPLGTDMTVNWAASGGKYIQSTFSQDSTSAKCINVTARWRKISADLAADAYVSTWEIIGNESNTSISSRRLADSPAWANYSATVDNASGVPTLITDFGYWSFTVAADPSIVLDQVFFSFTNFAPYSGTFASKFIVNGVQQNPTLFTAPSSFGTQETPPTLGSWSNSPPTLPGFYYDTDLAQLTGVPTSAKLMDVQSTVVGFDLGGTNGQVRVSFNQTDPLGLRYIGFSYHDPSPLDGAPKCYQQATTTTEPEITTTEPEITGEGAQTTDPPRETETTTTATNTTTTITTSSTETTTTATGTTTITTTHTSTTTQTTTTETTTKTTTTATPTTTSTTSTTETSTKTTTTTVTTTFTTLPYHFVDYMSAGANLPSTFGYKGRSTSLGKVITTDNLGYSCLQVEAIYTAGSQAQAMISNASGLSSIYAGSGGNWSLTFKSRFAEMAIETLYVGFTGLNSGQAGAQVSNFKLNGVSIQPTLLVSSAFLGLNDIATTAGTGTSAGFWYDAGNSALTGSAANSVTDSTSLGFPVTSSGTFAFEQTGVVGVRYFGFEFYDSNPTSDRAKCYVKTTTSTSTTATVTTTTTETVTKTTTTETTTTTTTTTTATTTTSSTTTTTLFNGKVLVSLAMSVDDPESFCSDPTNAESLANTLADSEGLPHEWVTAQLQTQRRLSDAAKPGWVTVTYSNLRWLQSTLVTALYTIKLPTNEDFKTSAAVPTLPSVNDIAASLTAFAGNSSKVSSFVSTLGAAGISVTVNSFSTPEVITTTTSTTSTSTTETTTSETTTTETKTTETSTTETATSTTGTTTKTTTVTATTETTTATDTTTTTTNTTTTSSITTSTTTASTTTETETSTTTTTTTPKPFDWPKWYGGVTDEALRHCKRPGLSHVPLDMPGHPVSNIKPWEDHARVCFERCRSIPLCGEFTVFDNDCHVQQWLAPKDWDWVTVFYSIDMFCVNMYVWEHPPK